MHREMHLRVGDDHIGNRKRKSSTRLYACRRGIVTEKRQSRLQAAKAYPAIDTKYFRSRTPYVCLFESILSYPAAISSILFPSRCRHHRSRIEVVSQSVSQSARSEEESSLLSSHSRASSFLYER